jgi:hypothetical protein
LQKLTECLFLTLTFSAFLIPSANVLGESVFGSQKHTEALLAIVTQANSTVSGILGNLQTRGLQTPPAAAALYDAGVASAAEALRLYNLESYEAAGTTAVAALEQFKAALDMVYTEVDDPAAQVPSAVELMRQLNRSITRGFLYLKYVEILAPILATQGYDTAGIRIRIQSARELLFKATHDLRRYRFASVEAALVRVKDLLETLRSRLAVIALELKTRRLATFIEVAETRLTRLKGTILSLSSELSPAATNASLTAVEDSERSLAAARSLLEGQQMGAVVTELEQAKASEEEARRILAANQPSTGSTSPSEPTLSSLEPSA